MSIQPAPVAFLSDWQSAELAAVEHMHALGFIDAQTTPAGADGGIDAVSSEAVAQVKFYASPVGRPDIQRLRGAAHEYRLALFYSTGGYTKEAVEYADRAGVALFHLDPYGQAAVASQLASILEDDELAQVRKARLLELKFIRYGLASYSFEQDLILYARFAREAPLSADESAVFGHVASQLDESVTAFRSSVEAREFDAADLAFEEINKRINVLQWITTERLCGPYDDLEAAVSKGQFLDSSPDSDHLLAYIGLGATGLNTRAAELLDGWEFAFSEGFSAVKLFDDDLQTAAMLLYSASIDPSILTQELLTQLKLSVRTGIGRLQESVNNYAAVLFERLMNADIARPKDVIAKHLHISVLAERVLRQLDASNH